MSTINREAWLVAMSATEPPVDPDALTLHEVAAVLGLERTAARFRIKKMIGAGLATATKKRIQDTAGRWQSVPAYRLADANK